MKHLPSEILSEIYSYLRIEDIVNLPFHITSKVFLTEEHKKCFSELYASLEKKPLQQIVRISANPSLADLVTKITFSTKRPALIDSEAFLEQAWKEHVRRRNKSITLAAEKVGASHHGRDPALKPKLTSELPEDLTFENFHEFLEVAESECSYCHDQSLNMQYICIEAMYLEWKSWYSRGQDISMLTLAFSLLRNLFEIHLDNGDNKRLERVIHKAADWTLGIPPFFFFRPRYTHPMHWSDSDLYEVIVQAIRPLQHVDGVSNPELLWSQSDQHVVVQAIWPLQPVDSVLRCNQRIRRFCYPESSFCLLLGNWLVFISRNVEEKIVVNNGIRNLGIEVTHDHTHDHTHDYHSHDYHKKQLCGFLSVSSIDRCVSDEFSPARWNSFFRSIRVPHITSLKLVSSIQLSDGLGPRPSFPKSRLLAWNISAYLFELDLSGYCMHHSTMIECLKAAVPTLRSLRLHRIVLLEGSWPSVFDQLGDQFCLESLSLELWDSVHRFVNFSESDVQHVLDWMCGRCDFHPIRMMDAVWVVS